MRAARVALLVLVMPLVMPLAGLADGPGLGPGWARLGPTSPRAPDLLAVDPNWPDSRVLLGARQPLTPEPEPFYAYVLRSTDGGDRWEVIPGPGVGVSDLQFAPGAVFLIDGDRLYGHQQAVYRSSDLGTTWRRVLELDPAASTSLGLSPTFGADQLAFVVSGGIAYRSRDGGQTFASIDPANGAAVRQVVFANDNHVFAVTDDSGATDAGWQGILVSCDGGDTWSPLSSDGLQSPDGDPMRDALQLIPSPTRVSDNTLFAVARSDETRSGVFRSQDGGASWELVAGGDATPFAQRTFSLVLSPTFDKDGFAALATNSAGPTPASHVCRLRTSAEHGATWIDGPRPGSYEGCMHIVVERVDGRLVATAWKSYTFVVSVDGDASWSGRLNMAPDQASDKPLPYARPIASKGTFFVPTVQGIMAFGGGVQPVAGQLACEPPIAGFGRVWQSEATARDQLGCPLEHERPVRIRVAIQGGNRQLWTEDDQPRTFDLLASHVMYRSPKGGTFATDHVVQGATQRFEGGVMLWLDEPDHRSIVVGYTSGHWTEYPD